MRRRTVRLALVLALAAVACGADDEGLAGTAGDDASGDTAGAGGGADGAGRVGDAGGSGADGGAGPVDSAGGGAGADGVAGDGGGLFDSGGADSGGLFSDSEGGVDSGASDAAPSDASLHDGAPGPDGTPGPDAGPAPDGSTLDGGGGADTTPSDATAAGDAGDAGDAGSPCVPALCDDGDPCTVDTCAAGACAHPPVPCDDGDPCTADACADGACTHVLTPATCPTPCPIAMALVPVGEGAACVDRWEASRADATSTSAGLASALPPASRAGVYPWSKLGQAAASTACVAAGKRLCTFAELGAACAGPAPLLFPWGDTYDDTACNGYASGLDKVALTGSFPGCVSPEGVYDLSGNVQEWTGTQSDKGNTCVFGGDYHPGNLSAVENQDSESCAPTLFQCIAYGDPEAAIYTNLGFRCCADPSGAP